MRSGVYNKFYIPRLNLGVCLGAFIISFIILISCIIGENYQSICVMNTIDESALIKVQRWQCIFKCTREILTVVCSILGTNLLLSVLIEKNSQNNLYTDIVCGEVFSNEDFYNKMSNDHKKILLSNLLSYDYLKNIHHVSSDIYNSISNKLNEIDLDYYYCLCDTIVECYIYDDKIVKKIYKKIILKSYQDSLSLDKFVVTKIILKEDDSFKVDEIKINSNNIKITENNYKSDAIDNPFHKKSNYNIARSFLLNKKLNLSNSNDTVIEIKYSTTVNIDDWSYTCRVNRPCKQYKFKFTIFDSNKAHKINSSAFGFLDNAQKTHNTDNKSEVYYEFNDWIFPKDGVSVTFI